MKKLLILGGMLAVPFSSFAAVLFDQSSGIEVDGPFADSLASNGSQFYGQAVADDFTLAANSTINKITFWGESENFEFDDNTNMASFQLTIFDSAFTQVGTWTLATATLTPTLTGSFGSFTGNSGFMYTANLSQALNAGTYFLHVGANLTDGQADAWAWSTATGNNDVKANFFDGNGFVDEAGFGDQAFKIEGTTSSVPEPASLAVLGLGAVAMLRRRKK